MKNNVTAIIVARNGSKRVPKKSMLKINGEPLLKYIIQIAKKLKNVNSISLATTNLKIDDPLVEIAKKEKISFYRGHKDHVLDRLYFTAKKEKSDTIVYIGGDCPLLDTSIIDNAINLFLLKKIDYLNNYEPLTFPGGMDINIINFKSLEIAFNKAIAPSQRINAFSYLTFHPDDFKIFYHKSNIKFKDLNKFHWYIDYPEDIDFIKLIYNKLYKGVPINIEEVLDLIIKDTEVRNYNKKLMKPLFNHAFFSSHNIMSEINNDIIYLSNMGLNFIKKGNNIKAKLIYREVELIVNKINKM